MLEQNRIKRVVADPGSASSHSACLAQPALDRFSVCPVFMCFAGRHQPCSGLSTSAPALNARFLQLELFGGSSGTPITRAQTSHAWIPAFIPLGLHYTLERQIEMASGQPFGGTVLFVHGPSFRAHRGSGYSFGGRPNQKPKRHHSSTTPPYPTPPSVIENVTSDARSDAALLPKDRMHTSKVERPSGNSPSANDTPTRPITVSSHTSTITEGPSRRYWYSDARHDYWD